MKTKVKKTYNFLLRLAIVLATYTFLYRQLFIKRDLEAFYNTFLEQFQQGFFLECLLIIFLLMFVNWGLEAWKWQFQISKIEKVSFFRSFQAILTGISVSAFLPNRVGDYFGRVFILEKGNHIEGILITIVGSISQFIATFFIGSLALVFFLPLFSDTSDYLYGYFYHAMLAMIIIANILTLIFYFNISVLTGLLQKISFKRWQKFREHVIAFSYFNRAELFKILSISILRYLIFSTQFYLLLRTFSLPIPVHYAYILIPVIYLLITAIPTVALSELGVRGSVSIYIFSLYFVQMGLQPEAYEVRVFSASSMIWLINIVLPALVGTFLVFRLKFFRKSD